MTIFLQKLQSSLPITVYAAIILFATKELVEFIKKLRGNRRKVEAIKEILAEEIELNYWSYKVFERTINDSLEHIENNVHGKYSLSETSTGVIIFHSKTNIGELSHPLPEVRHEIYDKLMIELAYLNEKIFKNVQNGYYIIKELKHARMTLIEILQDTEENKKDMLWTSFLEYYKEQLPGFYDGMNSLYKILKGNDLKEFKLR